MNNSYFHSAKNQAQKILGNKGRLLALITQLFKKVTTTKLSTDYYRDQFLLIGRLLRAFATGQYRQIPIKSVLLIIAAVIYFINPLDLIPDALIGIGLTDDLTVLTGVYKLVKTQLEKFREWELSGINS